MKIRYIFCNSKSEIPLKSMFKGLQTKVLYCIVDEEIFVHQGFKTIPVTMELFAEGMGIDLFEAQRIINNKVLFENLKTDKEVEGDIKVVDDVKDFAKTVTEKTKDTVDATKDTIDSTKDSATVMLNPGQLAREIDELAPDKLKNLPNTDFLDRIQELEYKVDMIMEHLGMNAVIDDEVNGTVVEDTTAEETGVEETVVEEVVIED